MAQNAPRDENHVPVIMGVSSADGTTPVPLYADPTSHRLLVDIGSVNMVPPVVDNTASGPYTASFNAGYTSAIGDLVYLDSSATWQKADADASATTYSGMLGIALEVKTSGNALTVALPGSMIYASGIFSGLTVGGIVYMSATAGAYTQTAPVTTDSATRIVGYAIASNKIWFTPDMTYVVHT